MGGTSEFDPYHKWLGIPPTERPVNHYRLLGLALFEDDIDVIAHAADRQMAHLKSFSAGPHASTSQQLLNVLATARLCLLNAEAKTAYDQQLRRTLSPVAPATASQPVESIPQTPSIKVRTSPQTTTPRKGHRKNVWVLTRLLNLAILIAIPAAVAYVLMVKLIPKSDFLGIFDPPVAMVAKDPAEPAQPTPKQPAKSSAAQRKPAVVPVPTNPSRTTIKAPNHTAQPIKQEQVTEPPAPTSSDQDLPPITSVTTNPLITLELPGSPGNRISQTIQAPPGQPNPGLPSSGNSQPPDPRHAVPDEKQQELSPSLDPIYQTQLELTRQQPAPERQAMLKILAEEVYAAHRIEADPPTRFLLLEKAIQIATESGDPTLTTEIIDDMVRQFKVDDLLLRATAVKAWSEQISKKHRGPEAQQMRGQLLPLILALAKRAENEHRYVGANKLYELASKQAIGNRERQRELKKLAGQARSKSKRHDAMMQLTKELEIPGVDHSDQLLELGRYWCFEQGDWNQGLRYFAASSPKEISAIAQLDLESQANSKDPEAVGDRWWNLAPPPGFLKYKNNLKARAVYWYELAMEDKQGLAKNRLEKKISKSRYILDKSGMIREIVSSLPAHLRNGLVAYYPFNGNARDESRNMNHGTVFGAALTTDRAGRAGKAYRFNKDISNRIQIPGDTLNGVPVFTWSFWVNLDSASKKTRDFLVSAANPRKADEFLISVISEKIVLVFKGRPLRGDSVLDWSSHWRHVVVTKSPTHTFHVFVDGVIVDQFASTPGALVVANNGLFLGTDQDSLGGGFEQKDVLRGTLDDVRIYNRALSAAEVKSLYEHEK
ncbi:MAG: hypothetical protein MK161_06830 [Pirellulales bacterium]|nr:hypothetical protein [Pirellulales bacterium]